MYPKNLFLEKHPLHFGRSFHFWKKKVGQLHQNFFPNSDFRFFLKFSKIDQNPKISTGSTECTQKTYSSKSTPFILAEVFIFEKKKLANFTKTFSPTAIFDFFWNFRKSTKIQKLALGVLNVPKKLIPRKAPPSFWSKFSFLKKKSWPTSPKLFPQQRFSIFFEIFENRPKSKN